MANNHEAGLIRFRVAFWASAILSYAIYYILLMLWYIVKLRNLTCQHALEKPMTFWPIYNKGITLYANMHESDIFLFWGGSYRIQQFKFEMYTSFFHHFDLRETYLFIYLFFLAICPNYFHITLYFHKTLFCITHHQS